MKLFMLLLKEIEGGFVSVTYSLLYLFDTKIGYEWKNSGPLTLHNPRSTSLFNSYIAPAIL